MQVSEIDISSANPKQQRFFKSRRKFIAYGGARGGGKSWALRKKLVLMALRFSGIKLLLLRRTYHDLRENHINILRFELRGIADYKEQEKTFFFPNGSKLILGYLSSDSDLLRYQGQEYDIIAIDEATQMLEKWFDALKASVRGANDFPKRMYLTCNPGGVGHEWVKRLFITKKYKPMENPDDYEFIAATVFDNSILMEKDKGYVDMLNSLDERLRAAWRDGSWDMLAGAYFSEFDRDIHVTAPFEVPSHWKKFRTIDYGLDCLACLWIAIDERGDYYVYREYAESDKIVSTGASDILKASGDENILFTTAPDDLWKRSQESAKAISDIFRENGLVLRKASRTRSAGWLAIKDLLAGQRLKIFRDCTELIDNLTSLQRDPDDACDCLTEPHDITHLPDALRYFCLQYTSPTKQEDKSWGFDRQLQDFKKRVLSGTRRR